MTEPTPEDEEPEVREGDLKEPPAKGRRSFQGVRRELSPEELNAPAVQRLLLDDVERLEGDLAAASGYRDRYHKADKDLAILQEKFRTYTAVEVMASGGLAAGSLFVGFVPSIWSSQPFGVLVLGLGILLVVLSIVAKSIKLWR